MRRRRRPQTVAMREATPTGVVCPHLLLQGAWVRAIDAFRDQCEEGLSFWRYSTGMVSCCRAAIRRPLRPQSQANFFIAMGSMQLGSGTQEAAFSPGDVPFCERMLDQPQDLRSEMAAFADVGEHSADPMSRRDECRIDFTQL